MVVMSYHYSYVAMYTGNEREVSGEAFKANAVIIVVCYRDGSGI